MSGMRPHLIPRWYSFLGDINLLLPALRELLPEVKRETTRGQPSKHPLKDYLLIIVLKECKKASLRTAETDWSEYVCGRRVDHGVIHYWEKHLPPQIIEDAVRRIGARLDELLGYQFSVIDATSFSNWHWSTVGFHLLTRISEETVYPVNICLDTLDPVPNTGDALVLGEGFLMGDRWYDVNSVFWMIYRHGYTPLIKPQRTRCKGRWRRKGRKVYAKEWRTYRQRGRGESPFGSLTNAFGDRLPTRLNETTYVRSVARVIAYQVKIYIRATLSGGVIIWVNN